MKKTWAILLIMLFAASVFAETPVIVIKKLCTCPKAVHAKCPVDSLAKVKNIVTLKMVDIQAKKVCAIKKVIDVPAKKVAKDEPKSIFSGLFGFDIPTSSIEDFILSAQKALIEKLS